MKLTFLSAAIPLTKTITYSQRDDLYTVSAYPMITRVHSHEYEANSMLEFAKLIREQGNKGHCLMFGQLDRPLVDESRAGHSLELPHDWICFDFDKVDAPPTMEGALAAIGEYLPKACHKAECVIQLSPSCFHPRATKLSAHVFMRLSEPYASSILKDFIVWANFNGPLKDQIRLTDSANSLSFALDRCVTDASRLIYIAPPKMVGFKSPLEARDAIAHYKGTPLTIAPFTPITREQMSAHINELRKANNLEEREFKTVNVRGIDVLRHPGECVIHDVRTSGDGYIRFNINGGNSLAYFINLREPQLVGNFKGEPYMYTHEANEQFYKALTKAAQAMPSNSRSSASTEVLAFYATNRNSSLYIGTYDRVTDELRVDKSTETAAASWLKQFGVPIKPVLPHYDLIHDVQSNVRYEEGYPVINLYSRTDFIKQYSELDRTLALGKSLLRLEQECPVIYKTMASITGDERSLMCFLNWIAYIFQKREKTGTAWLLWGIQGSGKGMFLTHVCKPIFGVTAQILMSTIDAGFNALLEGQLIVNIDEAAMTRSRDKIEMMSKLKNWITEPTIVINQKMEGHREVPSFVNFIFTSNDTRPIIIDDDDRRFHVGTRQTVRLQYKPNEMAILVQGEELPQFAAILGELIIDEHWVRNPEMTSAKSQLFEATHSLVDRVALALAEGDATFFFEARPDNIQLQTGRALLPIREYDALLTAMVDDKFNVISKEDLYVLFQTVVNDPRYFPENPTEQRRIYARHNLMPGDKESHRSKRTGKTTYGIKAPKWKPVPEHLLDVIKRDVPETKTGTVVPIGKK